MANPQKLLQEAQKEMAANFKSEPFTWPPALSAGELHRAVQHVKDWTVNSQSNLNNWLNTAINQSKYTALLCDYGQGLLNADQTRNFTAEDRDAALAAVQITRAGYRIAREYIDEQLNQIFPALQEVIDRIDEREEDRWRSHFHEDDHGSEEA